MAPWGGPEILRFQEWILMTCQGNTAIREARIYLLDLIEEPSVWWSAVAWAACHSPAQPCEEGDETV